MSSYQDFNQMIIDQFRANGGEVTAPVGKPLVLLHTKGAKSGKSHLNPVTYLKDGDRGIIIASAGGSDKHPAWYYNLLANPVVTVETGSGEMYQARATEVTDQEEHDRLYARMAAINPMFSDYLKKTSRPIPVIVLERVH